MRMPTRSEGLSRLPLSVSRELSQLLRMVAACFATAQKVCDNR